LKANFVYEFGLTDTDGASASSVASGTNLAGNITTRLAFVGLSGSFGALNLGRQQTIVDRAWGVGDVGGGNNFIGRAYTSSGKLNNDRSDRQIQYVSPAFSGFTVQAAMGERNNEATSVNAVDRSKETGLGIGYSAGALNAMIGYSVEDQTVNGAAVAKPEQLVLGANYDFKVAKAFVIYTEAENRDSSNAVVNDKKATEVGVAIPFGKTTLQASFLDGENKPTTTTKDDISGYQVGVLHAFSKRTTGYVVYGASEVKSKNTSAKTEIDQFGFGIRHAF